MSKKISLKTAGILIGAAAACAFLFGTIITVHFPNITSQNEAHAQNLSAAVTDEARESPFVKIAAIVSPAVVNISAERIIQQGNSPFEWRFEGPFEDLFRDFFRDFPRQEGKAQTLGSGFVISEDGYIVTNYHVIKDASDIIIRFTDKREYKGGDVTVVGTDSRTDIALLKIENDDDLPYLTFGDSDQAQVGDWAIAVGNPFQLEGTVTVGVISAKGRANIPLPEGPDLQSFLQTDAAINPGNSGGPLVNILGEVIGINTAITSPSGGNVGIGFAIPANIATTVIKALREEGKVTRGYLGVYLQDITEELKEALDLSSLKGVLISDIVSGTPADKAGIKSGDVVITFNKEAVLDMQSFRLQVSATKPGTKVPIQVVRNAKTISLKVTIGEYPTTVTAHEQKDEMESLGLAVVDLTDPRVQRYNIDAEYGVFIVEVMTNSPAEDAGLQGGDVILAIGNKKVKNKDDYTMLVKDLQAGRPVIFKIQRSGRKMFIAVTP